MLGGDLRGKKDSDAVCLCPHPVFHRCLLFPFHRNKGSSTAHPGQCDRLHCKRGGRKAQMENPLCLSQKAADSWQNNKLLLKLRFRNFPQKSRWHAERRATCF